MIRANSPKQTTRRRWFGLGRNNRGSVLLLVMIAAPVAAALFFSLIELVLISKNQTLINRNMVSYSAVMDGVIDYTNYAIKNRWCMTSTWTRDSNCNIRNPMSLERLTLDLSAITALRDLNAGDGSFTSAGVVSEEISTVINVSEIVNGHPLLNIVKNLDKTGKAVTQIAVSVKRVNDANIPRRGREVFLDVKVTLMSGSVIFRNLSAITATSRVMVTPRELNYFSLIVPRNLYLDGTVPGLGGSNGDIGIPAGTGGAGITFESPVFVNGDIFIPNAVANYTSVNFTNRVILGGSNGTSGGRLMRGSTPFSAPNDGNMSSYLYSVLPNFGGFKKGVDVDGIRDQGLDVIAGYNVTAPPANAVAASNRCIGVNNVFYKLKYTNQSDIVVKPLTPLVPNELRYLIGLTQGNMFVNQELRPYFPKGSNGRAKLMDTKTSATSSNRLNGQATMYFRYDSSPLATGPLGGTAYAGGPNNITVEFTLRPNAQVNINQPANVGGKPFGGRIEIEMAPVYHGGDTTKPMQMQLFELKVRAPYDNYPPETVQRFSLYMKAFDLGVFAGRDRRYPGSSVTSDSLVEGHSMEGWMHFQIKGGSVNSPGVLTRVDAAGGDSPTTSPIYTRLDPPATTVPVNYPAPPPAPAPTPPAAIPTPIPYKPLVYNPTDIPFPILPDENQPYQELVEDCLSNSGGSNSIAFKSIGWNSPFVTTTRHSWHFAPNPIPPTPDGAYNSIPVSPGTPVVMANGTFYVNSIVNQCIVPNTTTVASGFLTCDQLIIQPRAQPLLMIGTFIVNKAVIDPSAISSGITFRSIYHPQAGNDLTAQGVLRNKDGSPCTTPMPFPIWWPTLSNVQYDSFRKCSVVSLRDRANPFTWTAVNPDCGVVAGQTVVQCQKHAINYILNEISRTSELQ